MQNTKEKNRLPPTSRHVQFKRDCECLLRVYIKFYRRDESQLFYKKGVVGEMSQKAFFGRLRKNYEECKHLLICLDKI